MFFRPAYTPLNTIEIVSENLLRNLHYLQESSQFPISPVLKSNAYGHGIIEIGKVLDTQHLPFLCVDSIYEAYQLKNAGITTSILIMGYVDPKNLGIKKSQFSYATYDNVVLEKFSKYHPSAKLHLFVDTGMHREGISLEELQTICGGLKHTNFQIEGLMSHFALGDLPQNRLTKTQIQQFYLAKNLIAKHGINPPYLHIAASGATLRQKQFTKNSLGNMGRVGIALYGIDPMGKNKNLLPILQLTTTLVQIKQLKKGEKVGYDATFTANKEITIGVLPIGYNDGVDRRLSNKGVVMIGKTPCKILGRVSMNITIIDVSSITHPHLGEKVVIYSSNLKDPNTIQKAAKLCDTIPYELLIHLHPSTKREIV